MKVAFLLGLIFVSTATACHLQDMEKVMAGVVQAWTGHDDFEAIDQCLKEDVELQETLQEAKGYFSTHHDTWGLVKLYWKMQYGKEIMHAVHVKLNHNCEAIHDDVKTIMGFKKNFEHHPLQTLITILKNGKTNHKAIHGAFKDAFKTIHHKQFQEGGVKLGQAIGMMFAGFEENKNFMSLFF